jgi:tellurium resistance protein TerD
MPLSLSKGQNLSLTKEAGPAGLSQVVIGLGWDARSTDGAAFDLDSSAIVVGADGGVLSDRHFVYFNNLDSGDGAVRHSGDNLTGEGDGDDEQILLDLSVMPAHADRIVIAVSIYDAEQELVRYDLTEDAATETAMVFVEVYRHGAEWKFRAVGQGYSTGLAGIARDFRVNV